MGKPDTSGNSKTARGQGKVGQEAESNGAAGGLRGKSGGNCVVGKSWDFPGSPFAIISPLLLTLAFRGRLLREPFCEKSGFSPWKSWGSCPVRKVVTRKLVSDGPSYWPIRTEEDRAGRVGSRVNGRGAVTGV